jgi:hypothetical protein
MSVAGSDCPKMVQENLLKQLLVAYEKKKAYARKYMQSKRNENKETVNEYKRQLYQKKKELEKQKKAVEIAEAAS